jgi:hypothetical protein
MTYAINHYNGIKLVDVEDGRINDDYTAIKFVGRNYAGYGEVQNENFLWLLESFASASAPPKAVPGMVWYDSSKKKLKFWDNSNWRSTGGAWADTTPPVGVLTLGDLYYDTNAKQMYAYDDTAGLPNNGFILIGPQAVAGKGKTLFQSMAVTDTLNNTHAIVAGYTNDAVVMIMSTDSFTLKPGVSDINGFSYINAGITMINSATGSTTTTSPNFRFWGTATDSDKLHGIDYSEYVLRNGSVSFTGLAKFNTDDNNPNLINGGLTIGTNSDLKLYVDISTPNSLDHGPSVARRATIQNQVSNTIYFRTTDTNGTLVDGTTVRTPLILNNFTVVPGKHVTYDFGSDSAGLGGTPLWWNRMYASEVHAGTFYGTFSGNAGSADVSTRVLIENSPNPADPTWVDGTRNTHYRSAMTTSTAWTIAARDSAGDLTANVFHGTATSALYADLAERYAADAVYDPGTVLIFGGEQEVTTTVTIADTRVAGVVSTAPAYLMNAEAGDDISYPAIALRGKIPVKVTGSVRKGDVLVTSFMAGYAEVAVDQMNIPAAAIIGKSLENKIDDGLGIIMVVV